VTTQAWFAQPHHVLGTAVLLPGRRGGTDSPLLHWSATALTQSGWSVVGVRWEEGADQPAAPQVEDAAGAALDRADPDLPVVVVAKSLGTLALPWAVEQGLPGAWLTPLLGEGEVRAAVARAEQPTLLVGGSADPHWQPLPAVGPGVRTLELTGADHGLQRPGDWRGSLLEQVAIFDAVATLAAAVLRRR
jgi:pimeloyl-ACP methyl ester carboxylesterase